MKKLLMLVFGAVFALATPLAHADSLNQISFAGTVSYASATNGGTQVTFANSSGGTVQNASVFGTSTGIFSAFTGQTYGPGASPGSSVIFNDFNTKQTNFVLFSATAPNGQKVTFTVTSLSASTSSAGPALVGTGFYTFVTNGVTTTGSAGSFQMTSQGGTTMATNVSFSDTNTVTPEPSSLVLLGTGLVSAAGMLIRRRRTIVA